jgi:hypothetical protein
MTRRTRTSHEVENRLAALESGTETAEFGRQTLTAEERQYLDEMFGPVENLDRYTMEDRREFRRELEELHERPPLYERLNGESEAGK